MIEPDSPDKAKAMPQRVPSVANAFSIMRHLGRASQPEGVNQIARSLNLSPSSCFNLLRALTAENAVEFDPVSKKYRIGLGLADLARVAARGSDTVRSALPLLDDIAGRHQCAAGIWRLGADQRAVLLALSESGAATRIHMAVGQRQPLGAGAVGAALLAAMELPEARISDLFRSIRWQGDATLDSFRSKLDLVRRDGWAVDDGQLLRGVVSVAVRVPTPGDQPYCLSASMFAAGHSAAEIEAIARDLKNVADRLGTNRL